jgi:glycosyltransferase involved in cell wall biosynthesis
MGINIEVVIPCYNEELSIKYLVQKCEDIASRFPITFILVDNGSTDDTWINMKNCVTDLAKIKIERVQVNRGYGAGIISGLRLTTAPYVGWTHADLQTDLNDIIMALGLIENSKEPWLLIKGSRKNRPVIDRFFSATMSCFESILFSTKMVEINGQPTIFSRELISELKLAPNDFMLDLFVYRKAIQNKFSIEKVPVIFLKRPFGNSSWNKGFRSRIKFITRIVLYSFRLKFARI